VACGPPSLILAEPLPAVSTESAGPEWKPEVVLQRSPRVAARPARGMGAGGRSPQGPGEGAARNRGAALV